MQVSSNIEQPTSPFSLSSQPIAPKSSKEMMEIITKLLQKGQESAQFLRGLKLDDHQDSLDHHCLVALNSFKDALCIIQSFDFDHEDAVIRKRKLDRTNNIESFDHAKAEETGRGETSKERRGCYKRRRTGQTWIVEDTHLRDDGHAWRKYGQKGILNTKYPRSYYRCTHKYDQSYPCQATKQVQQISENPTKFNIIYNGLHTCKNTLKSSPIIINNPDKNSPYFLCFEHHNYPTVNSSASHCNSAMVNQEYTSTITEEHTISPSVPDDVDHLSGTHSNLQCSSSSENLPSSTTTSEITCSTPVSDQGDYWNYGLDEDNLVNFMMNMDYTHNHLDDIMKYY